jgi:EAL domain-containing protein (putative c-di-GMP-specific phosphodiesterase class I)
MRLVGVTELQGFFFSQAVPAQDVGELVKARVNAAPPARPAKASRRVSS